MRAIQFGKHVDHVVEFRDRKLCLQLVPAQLFIAKDDLARAVAIDLINHVCHGRVIEYEFTPPPGRSGAWVNRGNTVHDSIVIDHLLLCLHRLSLLGMIERHRTRYASHADSVASASYIKSSDVRLQPSTPRHD